MEPLKYSSLEHSAFFSNLNVLSSFKWPPQDQIPGGLSFYVFPSPWTSPSYIVPTISLATEWFVLKVCFSSWMWSVPFPSMIFGTTQTLNACLMSACGSQWRDLTFIGRVKYCEAQVSSFRKKEGILECGEVYWQPYNWLLDFLQFHRV